MALPCRPLALSDGTAGSHLPEWVALKNRNNQKCFNHSEEARYYHRLDLVMLAVSGMPVKEIAKSYNESPTTISYWTK